VRGADWQSGGSMKMIRRALDISQLLGAAKLQSVPGANNRCYASDLPGAQFTDNVVRYYHMIYAMTRVMMC